MRQFLIGISLVFLSMPGGPLRAQESNATPQATAAAVDITPEMVEVKRAEVESNETLHEGVKSRTLELYDDALVHLQAGQELAAKAAEFQQIRETAPAQAEQIQQALAAAPPEPALSVTNETPLAELEPIVSAAEAEAAAKQQQAQELAQEPERRAERRRVLPDLLVEARTRLQQARDRLSGPRAEEPLIAAAGLAFTQAEIQHVTNEIAAYEQELLSFEARNSLLTLRQDQATQELNRAQKRLTELRDLVTVRRQLDAEAAAQQARLAIVETLADAAPAVRTRFQEIAEKNRALAEERTASGGVVQKLKEVQGLLDGANPQLAELRAQYESVQGRIKAAGLNQSVAVLLRRYKAELPSSRLLEQSARQHETAVADTDLRAFELQEDRRALGDLDPVVESVLGGLPASYGSEQREQIAMTLRTQLQSQRQLLDDLIKEHQQYSSQVSQLAGKERELAGLADEFSAYINANILWSGGAQFVQVADLQQSLGGLYWLTSPSNWLELWAALLNDIIDDAVLYVLAVVLFLLLFFLKYRLRPRLKQAGEQARKPWHTRYKETVLASAITVTGAAPVPALVAFAGWRLRVGAQASLFAGAVAEGLLGAAAVLACLELLRQMFLRNGLVDAHFDWTAGQVRGTRHLFGVMAVLVAPLVFLVFSFEYQPLEEWKTSAGRFAFVLCMGVVAFFVFPLLLRIFRAMREQERKSWMSEHRLIRVFALFVCAGVPVLLGFVALTGFYYSALQLSIRLFFSMALVLGVFTLFAMMRRWMMITRRKLAIDQARRRREAAKDEDGETPAQEFTEEELDLARVDVQTQSLLRSLAVLGILFGVYFIWADILPALSILKERELWHATVQVDKVVTGPDGQEQVISVPESRPITAANVLFALFIVVVTVAAVKNLPSLLEIILVRWLHLGSGERYAVLAIVRYALLAAGVFFFFHAIGIGWGNVQWLVAAVGLGLGFGLQEIFANFVSGLILLFERPVRVGDIVTIGEESGVVSKIRIRATSVTNWDKKDLVIPNKELITGRVINWTLSDNLLRLKLVVGVTYGADARQVHDLLFELASGHPDVLQEPAPFVVLQQLGASALDFEVFVFVRLENGTRVRTELNILIQQRLKEAGIEIPYPQQDLHIRSGLDKLLEVREEVHGRSRGIEGEPGGTG